jgi:hypothetical protein
MGLLAIPAKAGTPEFRKYLSLNCFCGGAGSESATPAAVWIPACPTDLVRGLKAHGMA